MPHRNVQRPAAVYGIDIGKNIFHVVGLSRDGTPVQKVRFRRDTLLQVLPRAESQNWPFEKRNLSALTPSRITAYERFSKRV